jgi:co-chaperonin GroES (HSP10)
MGKNLQAVYDKLIVEIMEQEDTSATSSGIILTNDNKSVFSRGKVVSKGKGDFHNGIRIEMDVEVGDIILFNPNMASPLYSGHSNKMVVITNREIIAVEERGV